ncbi:MAG TPA: G1 family glutamic endopeptidase, partial [Candidatus Limnocylindria bacterium]|nr:G1 family glutamic endopeptidase [Candidatus Limnocylindria bacterium]
MFEGDPTATTPMTPLSPPPAPVRKSSGIPAGRLVALGLLAFALAAFTGRVDLGSLVSTAQNYVDRVVPTVQPSATASDTAAVAAVKDVIQRANDAQVQAFIRNDPTLMRATATTSYYQELVQTNQGLLSSGARSIALVNLEWVDVTVSGTTANAVTNETWRTAYTDGSVADSTDRNEYTLVLQAGAWKISADVQPTTQIITPGTGGGTPPSVTQPGTPASVTSSSSNWSGYAANGGTFTSVTATWTVPTVSASSSGADATWVGIGGLTSNDLIQAGTQAMVDGSGTVEYSAWTEMLPQSSRNIPLSVSAGDSVTVTLTQQAGNDWLIAMKNNTTGGTYSVTVQYRSSNSSAEWVQEAPSVGRGLISLDQFGTVQFSGASAVRDGKAMSLSTLGAKAITMINGQGQAIAQPSTVASDGSSFTVARTDATSS